jgi:hypothetical protein
MKEKKNAFVAIYDIIFLDSAHHYNDEGFLFLCISPLPPYFFPFNIAQNDIIIA